MNGEGAGPALVALVLVLGVIALVGVVVVVDALTREG
jgi:hypothetical protein